MKELNCLLLSMKMGLTVESCFQCHAIAYLAWHPFGVAEWALKGCHSVFTILVCLERMLEL